MSPVLGRLTRAGIRRGLLGGSRGWAWLGIGATVLRILVSLVRRKPERVVHERLRPGDELRIVARRSR
jgi:hypothetical protein